MNRIDGANPLSTSRTTQGLAAGATEGEGNRPGSSEGVGGRQDEISLSFRGRIVADAAREVRESPEIRQERVAALKAAIANGSYTSNAREIAARLLANGFGD